MSNSILQALNDACTKSNTPIFTVKTDQVPASTKRAAKPRPKKIDREINALVKFVNKR